MSDGLERRGPLTGVRIVEMGSLGPGPFCAMVLADLGADVIRVDRTQGAALVGPNADFRQELLHRGRRSIAVDLKHPEGKDVVLELVSRADALIEGWRPGVAERLGIGPDDCHAVNPRLIYGRATGFGQSGPLADTVGHDLNYIAHSGVLSLIGRRGQPPTPPLSLIGDFGGGGMLLALGVLAGILQARESGEGQTVDAAMIDGAALLGMPFFGFAATGTWNRERGTNIVDSGAPFYEVYETLDGRWLAVAAMEERFYAELLDVLGLDAATLPDRDDHAEWDELKRIFGEVIRTRTRDEWVVAANGRACVSAMLDIDEVPTHPHSIAREAFVELNGIPQPAPAPRFSRTPGAVSAPPPLPGEHSRSAPASWGIPSERVDGWLASKALADADPDSSVK